MKLVQKNRRRPGFVMLTLVTLMIAIAVIAGLVGFANTTIKSSQNSTLSSEMDNLANMSLTLSQHVQRVVFSADLLVSSLQEKVMLAGVRTPDEMRRYVSTQTMHVYMQDMLFHTTDVEALAFADASGQLSTSRASQPAIDISGRDYFIALRDGAKQVVTAPFKSSTNGQEIIVLARRLESADGQFLGIVSATLSTNRFNKLFSDVLRGKDTHIFLFRHDGHAIAEQPHSKDNDVAALAVWGIAESAMARADRANLKSRDFAATFEPHLIGLSNVSGYPLTVAVARSEIAALVQWHELSRLIHIFTACAIMMVILSAYAFLRLEKTSRTLAVTAEQLGAANKSLEQVNHRLTETQDYAHMGQWELYPATNKLTWSDEVYRIFEIDRTQVEATLDVFLSVVHPDEREAVYNAYLASLENKMPYEYTHRLLMPDGRIKHVIERCRTEYDETGKPVHSTGSVQDITELKAVEEKLRETSNAAQAASRSKSEFLANMSHEIRTPMNGIIGMTEVLLNTPLNERQMRMTNIIHDSAYTQLGILNDILDFSKIEAGKLELFIEPLSMENIVENTCALLASNAAQKQVKLTWAVDPHIPKTLAGDALRLRQILSNLVTNAVKFSTGLERQGQVFVHARATEEDDERIWIELSVLDNGIGMDQATQTRLFTAFTQGDVSTTRRYGGTGLGLVITRRLTEMMGGTMKMESTPNAGSHFILRIPLARMDESRQAERPPVTQLSVQVTENPFTPTRDEAIRQGRLILVAEDNEINQDVIRQQLNLFGLAADIVSDGREALARWATGDYALVLSDIHMPYMDGYQLTIAIREEEMKTGSGRTPIVALTANVLEGEAERCKSAGMDDYLAKPVPLSKLRATLEQWLPWVTGAVAKGQNDSTSSLSPADAEIPVWDETTLCRMVGDDPGLHRRLLEKFLITAQPRVNAILAAAAAGDAPEVGSQAHALKSAARTIGAMQLGDLCQKMELAGKTDDTQSCHTFTERLGGVFNATEKAIKVKLGA